MSIIKFDRNHKFFSKVGPWYSNFFSSLEIPYEKQQKLKMALKISIGIISMPVEDFENMDVLLGRRLHSHVIIHGIPSIESIIAFQFLQNSANCFI
jgi:hypothetical protein